MIRLYTTSKSKRTRFACELVFKHILKTAITWEDQAEGAHVIYGLESNGSAVQIEPHGLLEELNIHSIEVKTGQWGDLTTLFPTSGGDVGFDLFSASFYLATRYEEYLPSTRDKHGRFEASSSIAHQHGFIEIPLIDLWALQLKKELIKRFPDLIFGKRLFSYESSIDVDSAYAYLGKGLNRTLGGIAKDVLSWRMGNLMNRMKTLLGKKKDPFDTYRTYDEIHSEFNISARYFILLADYGPEDINLPHWSRRYRQLIQRLADKHPVGIHPGYVSNFYPEKLPVEIGRLSNILNKEIDSCRTHFLMLSFPETYQRLIQHGIQSDYTMGFADHIGFRASTCTPFPFFDLSENKSTSLMLHPFCFMDTTLNLYMKLGVEESLNRIDKIINTVRAVDGQAISVWHNESISEIWHWKGWLDVYKRHCALVGN